MPVAADLPALRTVGGGWRRGIFRWRGRPVVLLWAKRIWRCPDSDCAKKTWSERSELIAEGGADRAGLRRDLPAGGRRGGLGGRLGPRVRVSWAAAMAAVRDYGTPLVDDPGRLAGVTALGVGETTFLPAANGTAGVGLFWLPWSRTAWFESPRDRGRGARMIPRGPSAPHRRCQPWRALTLIAVILLSVISLTRAWQLMVTVPGAFKLKRSCR